MSFLFGDSRTYKLPLCTTRVWAECIGRNSWLEESNLETAGYKIKMALNYWTQEKLMSVSEHIVCRKANQKNELTTIPSNLSGKKFHSSPDY